jgi:hypothetical protein
MCGVEWPNLAKLATSYDVGSRGGADLGREAHNNLRHMWGEDPRLAGGLVIPLLDTWTLARDGRWRKNQRYNANERSE